VPAIVGALAGLGLTLFTDAAGKPWALALFAFAAFALTGLTQEFWRGAAARRTLHGGSMPTALVGIVARNRRRYGGYIVHAGISVLLIGIAASSSFQTNRDVQLRPGESAVVDGRTVTYVRPTATVDRLAFTGAAGAEGRGELHAAPDPALLPADRGGDGHDSRLLRRRIRQRHRLEAGAVE
jgi:cytochrome c-type biogenesis protein CcmF